MGGEGNSQVKILQVVFDDWIQGVATSVGF